MFGRLRSVIALVSNFAYLVSALFGFAHGYGFMYLILLFYVNIIVSQLQSSSNLMLVLPHMEDARHATTSHTSLCQRSRWLVRLTYVDDEALEGNEEGSKNE
jgi:hypothetical protein